MMINLVDIEGRPRGQLYIKGPYPEGNNEFTANEWILKLDGIEIRVMKHD